MVRSRSKILAITAGLLALAAVVPGLHLRGEAHVLLRAGGITIERVDEALVPRGAGLGADEGDLMISNGRIQAVVGASSEPSERRLELGAILDVTGPAYVDDALSAMRIAYQAGGKRAPFVVDRVEAEKDGGVPVIRIAARDPANLVWLTTTVRLRPNDDVLDLATDVENRGERAVTVRVGDDVAWPGLPTFVPGYGDVEETGKKSVRWIARRGVLSYGLVFADAPADVEFQKNQSDTAQSCWTRSAELAPGARFRYRRSLVATRHGLSNVARVAATLTGEPVGIVKTSLSPAPLWAIVTAVAADGTIAMKEGSRDDGSVELALPPGKYTLVLQSPGGWDETVVQVIPGASPVVARFVVPQAERLDYRITDASGQLIPARLVVSGVDGTADPRFALMPHVSASDNEVHSVSGEGHVDVPPGRYRVRAMRGIEWSLAERVVEVKPEQGVALRMTLTHDVPTPGWISADLHLHAKPSGDSEVSLTDRVASLVAAGVEFAVATDHNHVTDYAPAMEALGATPYLASARGVEVTTKSWGHFNAYPFAAKSPVPPHAGDPPEIFPAIRRISPDAVIQVNHPWMPGWGYFHRAAFNDRTGAHWRKQFSFDFDLIEVANGYELGSVDIIGRNLQRYFNILNLGRRYTAVGSSDSHKLTNEWAGYPRTYVRVADDHARRASTEEIVRSLREGHAIVSLGPFVDARIGTAGPGDTLQTAPGTLPLDVSVRAADWVSVNRVDVVIDGDIVDSFEVTDADVGDTVRWSRTLDIPVEHDSWVVVVVTGDHPLEAVLPGRHVTPFAFTNPIWVNVGRPEPAAAHPESRMGASEPARRPRAKRPEPVEVDFPFDDADEEQRAEASDAGPEPPDDAGVAP